MTKPVLKDWIQSRFEVTVRRQVADAVRDILKNRGSFAKPTMVILRFDDNTEERISVCED